MTQPLITDEIDVALDPNTGLLPPTGDLFMTSGLAAVVQGARIRMQNVAGEWFANLDDGVRYVARPDGSVTQAQAILGAKFDPAKAIAEFRRVLLGDATTVGVPGLLSVTIACDFNASTRTITITWSGTTAFGDTPEDVLPVGGQS